MNSKTTLMYIMAACCCLIFLSSCQALSIVYRTGKLVAEETQQQNLSVMRNMIAAQKAADNYAGHHNGKVPPTVDELKCCYPAGDWLTKQPGTAPVNPFTNKPEWPNVGNITNLREARKRPLDLKPGEVQYNSLDLNGSYAIVGGNDSGKAFSGKDFARLDWLKGNVEPPNIPADIPLPEQLTIVVSNH
jgi:hypothetical protein